MNLQLSIGMAANPRTWPVFDGRVKPDGIDLVPSNHGMVVKREIAERHPWVMLNLLKSFERANEIAERERLEHGQYHVATGLVDKNVLRTALVRHGIKANRMVLETAAQYSREQGLTPRRVRLEELFAASVMGE